MHTEIRFDRRNNDFLKSSVHRSLAWTTSGAGERHMRVASREFFRDNG